MKDTEGFGYGQHVAFRDKRGTVVGRPRELKGKYKIACDDGVKRLILACEITPVAGPARPPHYLQKKSDG